MLSAAETVCSMVRPGLGQLMGSGDQWILMGINNFPLILMEINGHLWVFLGD